MHPNILLRRIGTPHAQKMERWFGSEMMGTIEQAVAPTYWPLPIGNIPSVGGIYGYKGEFYGKTKFGQAASMADLFWDGLKRASRRMSRKATVYMAFSSLSDAIAEATGGKLQSPLPIFKNGPTGVVGVTSSLWRLGAVPAAGTVGAALAGGTTYDRTSTGAIGPQTNAAGGDTLHLMSAMMSGSVAANCLLLYDRLWAGAPNMNSNATQTVTYTRPSRYGDTEVNGTFCFLAVTGTALAATGHNITVCQYTNQAGTTGRSIPSTAGVSGAIVDRLDHAGFLLPLQAGDTGIRVLTQFQISAAVATGSAEFVHGMQLALMPTPFANVMQPYNYFGSVFNPVRIRDDACLALLEIAKGATTATNYQGMLTICSG